MDTTTLTRIGLGIASFIFLFLLIKCYQNMEAPDGIKSSWVLIGTIVSLLGIVFAIQNQYQFKKRFVFSIFYDTKVKKLTFGADSRNAYISHYGSMFANLTPNELKIDDPMKISGDFGLNLIEYGIINELDNRFMGTWDYDPIFFDTPAGQIISFSGSDSKKKSVSRTEIRKIFNQNPFINSEKFISMGLDLNGPPNFKIIRKEFLNLGLRTITIKNTISKVEISMQPFFGGPLQHSALGMKIIKRQDMSRYWVQNFEVEINASFENFIPINWNERKSYERWHQNIANAIERFDWKVVQQEDEKIQKK